ncbi:hypothetical protein [Aeromonas veronii]|uniref:hypothetical protein n=1 Tax=Aeromonas veronii TaxID=654 RepID=UPI003BA0D66B
MAFELTYRPLELTKDKNYFKRSINNPNLFIPDTERGCFLVLQSVHALHETIHLPPQSLKNAWIANQEYIKSGCIGDAPLASYPIYLITIGSDSDERLVYVGKTSSNSSRFSSGHTAISKLHHPKYNNLTNRLYLCCIVFIKNSNTIPIEWITQYEHANSLLKSFEANLIYWSEPELNTHHKNKEPTFEYGPVHVQNVTGETEFWHDRFI